jgi:hypothetical protein
VDDETLERVRARLVSLQNEEAVQSDVHAALDRARHGLERLAETAAELQSSLPTQVSDALQDGLRAEVLPVARHVAEVRGMSGQMIRRLEGLESALAAERRARVDDLAVLVELIASGWQTVERRLDRIDRSLDRVERELERRTAGGLRPA